MSKNHREDRHVIPTNKAKNKLPKLRQLFCVICKKEFWRHIAPSDIKSGHGKVCSKECKNKLSSINNKRGEYIKCKRCHELFWTTPSQNKENAKRKYCSRKCYTPVERGKSISYDGYYWINNKKVHRIIMEEALGRKLTHKEIVHHINGDKLDNRLENLQIVTRSEHNKIHKSLTHSI